MENQPDDFGLDVTPAIPHGFSRGNRVGSLLAQAGFVSTAE
jgi:hypothetical protein